MSNASPARDREPGRRAAAIFGSMIIPGAGHVVLGRWGRGLVWWAIMVAALVSMPWTHQYALLATLTVYVLIVADSAFVKKSRAPLHGWMTGLTVVALLVAWFGVRLVTRIAIVEPYRVPQSGMLPTIAPEDHIFVNKLDVAPQRGRVAVFKYAPHDYTWAQRIVALAGDRVRLDGETLYVNGVAVPSRTLGPCGAWDTSTPANPRRVAAATCAEETIDGRAYRVGHTRNGEARSFPGEGYPVQGDEFVVPEGSFFAIGDNRDNSLDSRARGAVPVENIIGTPMFTWLSFDPDGLVRWDRLGAAIH